MTVEINDLLRACVGREDPTILDIGSNDGMTALSFKGVFPDALIHCFEPDLRAYDRAIKLLDGISNIHMHKFAISDHDGISTFYKSNGRHPDDLSLMNSRPGGWDLSGSLHRPKQHLIDNPWITFDEVMEVETRSLDSWTEELGIGNIDLIWMDVQGAESEVLRGGKRSVRETRYIFTEYFDYELYEGQPSLADIMDLLECFTIERKYDQDALLRNNNLRSVF